MFVGTVTPVQRFIVELQAAGVLARAGMIGLDALPSVGKAIRRYGTAGAACRIAALRHGSRAGLVDEQGSLTFAELDRRSNAVANGLRGQGCTSDSGIGILCRNHRGVFDALFGAAKLGARTVLLNTEFSAPQLAAVCARERVELLIHDEEFEPDVPVRRMGSGAELAALISANDPSPPPAPERFQRLVLLTSGTTGTPKGAPRAIGQSLALPAGLLSKIPYRSGDRIHVAAPLFHGWGLLTASVAVAIGATVVTRRRFDAAATVRTLVDERCTARAAVPNMLARVLDEVGSHDLGGVRIIACAGSQLGAGLCVRTRALLGDVLYNLYGSTEVAYATIATPADLRAAPGCVGTPTLGSVVKLLDEADREVTPGAIGRIFVANGARFTGYTDGTNRRVVHGLTHSGDLGHLDDAGRLFVDGRDDDMIVSGGENVFPQEVEELIGGHDGVAEAAVFGVPDDEYGQRLCAYVVPHNGFELSAEDVRTFVRANLARYKVPRDVVFLDALPRNAAGKVVRGAL
jgi:fatty-acyl-CoA synthase